MTRINGRAFGSEAASAADPPGRARKPKARMSVSTALRIFFQNAGLINLWCRSCSLHVNGVDDEDRVVRFFDQHQGQHHFILAFKPRPRDTGSIYRLVHAGKRRSG